MLPRGLDGSYCSNLGPADRPASSQGSSCHQLAQVNTTRSTAAEMWPETRTSGLPARGDTLPKSQQETDLQARYSQGLRHSYGLLQTRTFAASSASCRPGACTALGAHQLNSAGQSSNHHSPPESREEGAAAGRRGEKSKTSQHLGDKEA